jgi:hypothetical protein
MQDTPLQGDVDLKVAIRAQNRVIACANELKKNRGQQGNPNFLHNDENIFIL